MVRIRRALHAFNNATSLSAARPAYAAGLRASLATVVPLAIAELLGLPAAGTWMSFGGFNAALSDKGGSYRTRALTMAAVAGASAVAALLGSIVSGHLLASLVATFVLATAASVMRVWGNPGISIGSASLTVYVVALAIPPQSPTDTLMRAAYLVMGTAWAMMLAVVLWPLRPYRPARLAIASCYEALASYVEQVAEGTRLQQTAEWPVSATTRLGVTNVRASLETARTTLVQLRRGRPGAVDRGERLLVLGESADQLFGHIVALGETLAAIRAESRNDALHEHCAALLRECASTCRALAASVLLEDQREPIPVTWSGASLRAMIAATTDGPVDAAYEHAAVVIDRAAQFASSASVTLEIVNGGTPADESLALAELVRAPSAGEIQEAGAMWQSFRAMLSPGSLILRFALRVAVVTTIAVAMTELLHIKRGYWVTITAIVVVQPYTGVTLLRAIQRVLGTVLGAILAAALGAYFHDPRAILVIAAVFVACCVALLPLNYAAFSVFLTPTFVLLAEASAGDWSLAETRVTATLLGGALALLGSRVLWPSPERSRFPSYVAAAMAANAEYLRTVIDGYDDTSDVAGDRMRAARRAVGLATVNAEESLQRALTEAHGETRALSPALTLLTYTRRFTASVAALAVARHARDGTTRAVLAPFVSVTDAVLSDLSVALNEERAPAPLPAPLPEDPRLPLTALVRARVARLARQAGTLHDAVARLNEQGGSQKA